MITKDPEEHRTRYSNMHKGLVEEIARKLCKSYHIKEIITPVFAYNLSKGVGETTDESMRCTPLTKVIEA